MLSHRTAASRWRHAVALAAFLVLSLSTAASAESWMGVQVGEVPEELARANGLPPGIGVYVLDVLPEGPAATAGVEPGDVVVEIDGVVQFGPRHLQAIVGGGAAQQTLWVGLLRDGEPMSGPITLTEVPPQPAEHVEEVFATAGVTAQPREPFQRKWY